MYIDHLIEHSKERIDLFNKIIDSSRIIWNDKNSSSHQRYSTYEEYKEDLSRIVSYHTMLDYELKQARIFHIEKKQADIFYEMPHENQNYQITFQTPFPYTFIELSNSMEITDSLSEKDKSKLKGMLFVNNTKAMADSKHPAFMTNDSYVITAFYTNRDRQAHTTFKLEKLPQFTFTPCYKSKDCNYANSSNIISETFKKHMGFCFGHVGKYENKCWVSSFERKKLDLIINLVNFVNARNVEFERIRQGSPDHDKKRRKSGREPLRDYYAVKVNKTQYNYSGGEPGEGGKHSFRYDVRGHFRFYEKNTPEEHPLWIEPHQRGLANKIYKPKIWKVEDQ